MQAILSQSFRVAADRTLPTAYLARPMSALPQRCHFIDAVIANDWAVRLSACKLQISQLERDADKLKKECPVICPKSFPASAQVPTCWSC